MKSVQNEADNKDYSYIIHSSHYSIYIYTYYQPKYTPYTGNAILAVPWSITLKNIHYKQENAASISL
jgi:hypothetical protein